MAYAYGHVPVDRPADEASSFGVHESLGHPIFDLATGKNADFAAKVEKLTGTASVAGEGCESGEYA